MRNSEYWQKRWDTLQLALMQKAKNYDKNINQAYKYALVKIKKDINDFYQKFAINNEVDFTEAKKILNKNELKEFKWDVKEYIRKAKTLKYSKIWIKELENASIKYRVSRLEALETQIKSKIADVSYITEDILKKTTTDSFKESYYRSGFEFQKGLNLAVEFPKLNSDTVNNIISKPWAVDGTNFSERVWGENRAELVQKLHKDLTQSIIRGDGIEPLTAQISHTFDVSLAKSRRLVSTENAFFASIGNKKSLQNCGTKYFTISATLDRKTCEDCGYREGEKIPMSEWEIGITAPPFHPNCRCVATPIIDDDFESIFRDGTRIARDTNGKSIRIQDMTYKQWKEKYVDEDE